MANSAVVGTLRAILSADTAEFASAMKTASAAAEKTAEDVKKSGAAFATLEPRMASVTRLVKDFSGSLERRSAEEFALAIDKIGGAAKLSESELRRASAVFTDYISKARAMGQEVPPHIQKVATEISRLSTVSTGSVGVIGQIRGAFQNLGPSIAAAAGGFATALISVEALTRGLRLAIDFVKDSISAYAEAEKSTRKLTAALEAQGQATPETIRAYEKLANQFQKTTVFQDDLIMEMQTLLVQVGNVMPSEMEKALEAVTNLASGLGIDLRSATLMVANAAEDNFRALRRQNIQIDETRAAAEGFDYILGQINKKFGGQAAADLATFDGQLKSTQNQFNELQETIGEVIVKSTGFQLAFAALRAELAQLEHEIKVVVSGFKVLGTVPGPVGAAFSTVFGNLKDASRSAKDVHLAIEAIQGPVQSTTQKLPPLTKAIRENKVAVDESEKSYRDWADTVTGAKTLRALGDLEIRLSRLNKELTPNERALRAVAEEAAALQRQGMILSPELQNLVNRFLGLKAGIVSTTVSLPPFSDVLSVSGDEIRAAAKEAQDFAKVIDDFNRKINTSKGLQDLFKGGVSGKDLQDARDQIKSFSDQASKALLTIGDAFDDVGRAIGGDAGHIVSSIGQVTEALGELASGSPTGIIAGVTRLIGLMGAFKTLGRNIARDMQDAFATTDLGFDNLNQLMQHLRDLGAIDLVNAGDRAQRKDDEDATRRWMEDVREFLDEIDRRAALAFDQLSQAAEDFGGKAPAALQPFIQELLRANTLTAEQRDLLNGLAGAPEWEQLQSIAQKYGIELSALGQSFQQARIGDIALQFSRDFMTLRDAGGDVNGLLVGMQDEVQALVKDARMFGTAMPEALRPVIEGLISMGLLTDENGNKFEDLASTGLTFTGTLEDAFKDMKSILEEIRDLLAGGLPNAARSGGQQVEKEYTSIFDRIRRQVEDQRIVIPIEFDVGSFAPPSGFAAPEMHEGGVTKRGGLFNLNPNEMVIPLDDAQGGAFRIDNRLFIDGREVTTSVVRHLREEARRQGVRPI